MAYESYKTEEENKILNNIKSSQAMGCQFVKLDNQWQPIGTFTEETIKEIYNTLKERYRENDENDWLKTNIEPINNSIDELLDRVNELRIKKKELQERFIRQPVQFKKGDRVRHPYSGELYFAEYTDYDSNLAYCLKDGNYDYYEIAETDHTIEDVQNLTLITDDK